MCKPRENVTFTLMLSAGLLVWHRGVTLLWSVLRLPAGGIGLGLGFRGFQLLSLLLQDFLFRSHSGLLDGAGGHRDRSGGKTLRPQPP